MDACAEREHLRALRLLELQRMAAVAREAEEKAKEAGDKRQLELQRLTAEVKEAEEKARKAEFSRRREEDPPTASKTRQDKTASLSVPFVSPMTVSVASVTASATPASPLASGSEPLFAVQSHEAQQDPTPYST